MNPKVITSINESWWAAVSITPEFLFKVEEMHGKPQVSKIGGRHVPAPCIHHSPYHQRYTG